MAKGTKAKENVAQKLKSIYGDDFIGEYQKKIYIWEQDDGGQKVQIAVSMTCPKNIVGEVQTGGDLNFESAPILGVSGYEPATFTKEEEEDIQNLMKKLGF